MLIYLTNGYASIGPISHYINIGLGPRQKDKLNASVLVNIKFTYIILIAVIYPPLK